MDYGDGSYACHLTEFLEGVDEPVNNRFRWYNVLRLKKLQKLVLKSLFRI